MDTKKIHTIGDLRSWSNSGVSLAVIGNPIKHSLSPIMHNRTLLNFSKDNLEFKKWAYFKFQIDIEDLEEALCLFYEKNFYGINLTVPHKVKALKSIEIISEEARLIGAVNTLIKTEHGYKGLNTDGFGIKKGIEYSLGESLDNKNVLIVGAGGAARAAVVECLRNNTKNIFIKNRSKSRLDDLYKSVSNIKNSKRISLIYNNDEEVKNLPDYGICINATSLGMDIKDPMPIDLNSLPPSWAVYDMVYDPPKTKLIELALKQKRNASTGLSMLVFQGAKSMEIWSNQSVDARYLFDSVSSYIMK